MAACWPAARLSGAGESAASTRPDAIATAADTTSAVEQVRRMTVDLKEPDQTGIDAKAPTVHTPAWRHLHRSAPSLDDLTALLLECRDPLVDRRESGGGRPRGAKTQLHSSDFE